MMTYPLKSRVRTWFAMLFLAGSLLFRNAPLGGQVINWNNPAGGSYNTAANWNPANVPNTASETANFSLAGTFTVNFAANSNITIEDLLVSAGNVTFSNAGLSNDATLNVIDDFFLNGGDLTLTRVGVTTADVNLIVTDSFNLSNGSELKIQETALVQTDRLLMGTSPTSATIEISEGGDLVSFLTEIGDGIGSNGAVTVTGSGSTWNNGNVIRVGNSGNGELLVSQGAVISSSTGVIGTNNNATGTATITGDQSSWTMSSGFAVGLSGLGSLYVEAGGTVSNVNGTIGNLSGNGIVTISGLGSTWEDTGTLGVGHNSTGTLIIEDAGTVSNSLDGYIARNTGSTGTVHVRGQGATWTNSGSLFVGGSDSTIGNSGTLNVETGGIVEVGTDLVVLSPGTVNLLGGEIVTDQIDMLGGKFNFYFGKLRLTSDQTLAVGNGLTQVFGNTPVLKLGQHLDIEGTATLLTQTVIDGGTLSAEQLVNAQLLDFRRGTLNLTNQAIMIATNGPFGNHVDLPSGATINVSLGTLNQGLVTGNGAFGGMFENDTTGEVRATVGHELRFTGPGNINRGQMNLFGGTIELTEDLENNSAGFISGNGTLIVTGGLVNAGTINLSGSANVSGDVTNSLGGLVVSAGGTTTFFDDVVNNGEIRTSANSFTVYFGSYSGNGDTGTGTIIMEGDLKPGSSPGLTAFAGNLVFGNQASLNIEIGGTSAGISYDRVEVTGFADLMGTLDVTLVNNFTPELGDSFAFLFSGGGYNFNFSEVNLPDISSLGLDWQISPGGSTVFLKVVSALPGDFDHDGDVDGKDFLVWQRNPSVGNLADWQANYGAPLVAAAKAASPVPEPEAFLLLSSAFVILSGLPRRSREFN